jgi:hypothetical protein
MNATLTLVMYWSIALLLASGGIYALKKGFNLVTFEIAHKSSASSVEFFGFKASVNSIGALVMVTAFLWGWAANLTLPDYDDGSTKIALLEEELSDSRYLLAAAEEKSNELLALNRELEVSYKAMQASIEDNGQFNIGENINYDRFISLASKQSESLFKADKAVKNRDIDAAQIYLLEGKEASREMKSLIEKFPDK